MGNGKVDIKARLLALKKLGYLPNVSARGTPDATTRKRINDTFRKHGKLADAFASGKYNRQSVANYLPGELAALKSAGVQVVDGKAYVPVQDGVSAKLVRRKEKIDGQLRKSVMVERKMKNGEIETEYVGSPLDAYDRRNRFQRQYEELKLEKGEFFGVKTFENGRFKRAYFNSLSSFEKYEERAMNWHTGDRELVREHMHLVKLNTQDLAELERQSAEHKKAKNKARRSKSKSIGRARRK